MNPKSAVIKISRESLIDEVPLKKLSVFFDNIYIYDFSLEMMKIGIQYSGKLSQEEKQRNVQGIEWLIDRFYNALRRRSVTVRFLLPRQPHGPTEPKMILKVMQTNLEWMQKYLLQNSKGF